MTTQSATLAAALWPVEGRQQAWLRNIALVLAGSAVMAASAQFSVPMWPVPMTLQTLAALVIGMAYGGRLGAATLMAYLAQGAAGLPVFSNGHAFLTGAPSEGYLFGMLFSAAFVGMLADRGWGRRPVTALLALTIGSIITYVPGLVWLHFAYLHDLQATLATGLFPFVLGDILKVALAAAALPFVWKLVGKLRA
jgi:biotin transport system substrate-specific component